MQSMFFCMSLCLYFSCRWWRFFSRLHSGVSTWPDHDFQPSRLPTRGKDSEKQIFKKYDAPWTWSCCETHVPWPWVEFFGYQQWWDAFEFLHVAYIFSQERPVHRTMKVKYIYPNSYWCYTPLNKYSKESWTSWWCISYWMAMYLCCKFLVCERVVFLRHVHPDMVPNRFNPLLVHWSEWHRNWQWCDNWQWHREGMDVSNSFEFQNKSFQAISCEQLYCVL